MWMWLPIQAVTSIVIYLISVSKRNLLFNPPWQCSEFRLPREPWYIIIANKFNVYGNSLSAASTCKWVNATSRQGFV